MATNSPNIISEGNNGDVYQFMMNKSILVSFSPLYNARKMIANFMVLWMSVRENLGICYVVIKKLYKIGQEF